MSILNRILRRSDPRDAWAPLYRALTARAREPFWYATGGVPDSVDGRFEAIILLLALTLRRIEPDDAQGSVHLTELFVADMDAQMRQIGFGDLIVGKRVGGLVGALGGRLGAYAETSDRAALGAALDRNLWAGSPPAGHAREAVIDRVRAFADGLAARDVARLREGDLP